MYFQQPPLGTQLDWSNPLNKGLVMHLAMNEGNGDKVQDLSMYGNHGTLHGMAFPPTVASGWNPGKGGIGLKFDGVNDYVNCGNKASLQTSIFTYSAWIKPAALGGVQTIIAGSALQGAPCFRTAENNVTLSKQDTTVIGTSTGTITNNVWSMVAVSYDASGNYKFYLNGELAGSGTNLQTFDFAGLWIGGKGWWENPPANVFNGFIDTVRILNRTYTAKEVLDYYMNPYGVYLD